MDIATIKQQLNITAVIEHYGLHFDKHQRLHCPFHDDTTPSLQIYPKTNTYCCFSANCTAGTGDVIQFIQCYERCTKHEAIVKAKTFINNWSTTAHHKPKQAMPQQVSGDANGKVAVLTKLFTYFSKAIPLTQRAVAYVEQRHINYKVHDIGFNRGDWHHILKDKNFITQCETCGLLKPRPAKGYNVWAKDCIIFPLKNTENKIVSLYGRSITNNEESRHFYLTGRAGLYPYYPSLQTKKLILTESIIDAASLLQQKEITEYYSILALYGTNGLTDEHLQAIIQLPQLEEIILILNADDAGKVATQKHYNSLKKLLPEIKITHVPLPDEEDINSVLCNHDNPKVLFDLIESRKVFSPFIAEQKQDVATTHQPINVSTNQLIVNNPELLLYNNDSLHIAILGGIKITGLDRMKLTLKIIHKNKTILPIWHSLDLYNHTQREQVINHIVETFDISTTETNTIFSQLISELEHYRLQKIESLQPKPVNNIEMSAAEKQLALNELKKSNLLQRTNQLIALSGIVGEEQNRLIAYLIYTMRKQTVPLHVMFLGSSGSGKTYLQEKISELIPEEDKLEITQITENALYYFKQKELQHKLLLIEDLDGASNVFYPLRELQTKRKISKTVTLKDNKGNLKTITLTVEGPVCVSGCTTKEKIYEDNANRCILLYIDQSKTQDKKITEYQTASAAGSINKQTEQQYKQLCKNIQRLLQSIKIINPYAKYITLPEQIFKPRRTMTLLLGFIEAITFYHQHQRTLQHDNTGIPYIASTIEDIQQAFTLLKNVLFSKSDELTNATRNFFEQLKQHIQQQQQQHFSPQHIRKLFRLQPRTVQRYIRELHQYGYIKQISPYKHRKGYEYSISDEQEYTQLHSAITQHVQNIIAQIQEA